jgi:hypothetical protein
MISRRCGFTNVDRDGYQGLKAEKRVLKCLLCSRWWWYAWLTRLLSDGAHECCIRPRGSATDLKKEDIGGAGGVGVLDEEQEGGRQ